ncbi:hypothetical protein HQN89_22045 [Paenibacillus frigoriresistens]|uniref:hypothetical protein n=1 Tax=Paenibacillus alginolyticus TaxID=59839 RepID=UPI0015656161|nr:hypothetical protein [Paenibacillus frigoriresistens]NRF93630.1 hypothetical protein [Paenibacillus frigoriresistens]
MTQTLAYKGQVDNKVQAILVGLSSGKSRDQLAIEMKYKDYKGIDNYMKRKNYEWDNTRKNYFPIKEKKSSASLLQNPEGRVATILSLYKRGVDAKDIALQLKFQDHREMALYLRSKGYVWDETQSTYVFKGESQTSSYEERVLKEEKSTVTDTKKTEVEEIKSRTGVGQSMLSFDENSLRLINFLESNKEALMDMLKSQSNTLQIPRYLIPGVCITKSVHMNYGLDQMTREFSMEKNVSQKDIFEVALIDFFKKYGYQKEISVLLGH